MRAIPLIIVFVAYVAFNTSAFVVKESEQALVTQFGKIIGKPIDKAGLYWKIPFLQDVRYFDKRILSWDGDPNQIPTKDKKYILVDTTARWRIVDPVKFAQTVLTEDGARSRLDGILDGVTRDVISGHNLVEAVRNTNTILDRIKLRKSQSEKPKDLPVGDLASIEIEEEISGEIEPIKVGREKLSDDILTRAQSEIAKLGIELKDVQLRRIAYEASVESKVFSRMISERQRIAEKIRSIGKGEEAKINGKLNRDLKEIQSNAYRKAEEVKGVAEAEAIAIYAITLNKNPDYYKFHRTLEAYRKSLLNRSDLILTTDSEFLRLLKKK